MVGRETAIARRIGWKAVRISNPKIKVDRSGITQEGSFHGGLGIRRSERVDAPLEFTIEAMVPTSALLEADYLMMLRKAGEFVGLSPARSAWYGDFEVIEVVDEA